MKLELRNTIIGGDLEIYLMEDEQFSRIHFHTINSHLQRDRRDKDHEPDCTDDPIKPFLICSGDNMEQIVKAFINYGIKNNITVDDFNPHNIIEKPLLIAGQTLGEFRESDIDIIRNENEFLREQVSDLQGALIDVATCSYHKHKSKKC